MYERAGYAAIENFNANPVASFFARSGCRSTAAGSPSPDGGSGSLRPCPASASPSPASRRWCWRLSVPSLAHAAHVTSAKPWAAGNEYHVEANLDGRTQAKDKPRAKVDWVKAGQWVKIQCQMKGELLAGSRIWDKIGGYFVPDDYIKTYTDGFLSGSPRCGAPPPGNPTTPPDRRVPRRHPGGDTKATPPPPPAPTPGRRLQGGRRSTSGR